MKGYLSASALIEDERTQLEAFLHDQRLEVAGLLDGLTDVQARRRLVLSLTTPLAIVKHCAFVERVWFEVALLGRSREELGLPADVDTSFLPADDETVESVLGDFRVACARSERIAAQYGLDDIAHHNRRSPMSLRWIYLHLIEELARHAGHGDILREQILAADA